MATKRPAAAMEEDGFQKFPQQLLQKIYPKNSEEKCSANVFLRRNLTKEFSPKKSLDS